MGGRQTVAHPFGYAQQALAKRNYCEKHRCS